MSGFQAKFAYGTDNAAVDANASTTAGTLPLVKSVISASGTFEDDMLYAALAYEAHNDAVSQPQSGVAPALKGNNTATRVVAAYKFGHDAWLGMTYESLSVATLVKPATATATVASATRTNWEIVGSYKMGANVFGATYAVASDLGSFASTGATQYSLRYGYTLSKRTEAYAMYSSLTNNTYGQYNFSAGNTLTSSAGAKLSGFGFGVAHSF
jgi:hypothetical protein